MTILLDTNIILDFLCQREPFFDNALKILKYAEVREYKAYITANSVTDIFYILRKQLDKAKIKTAIGHILQIVDIVSVSKTDIFKSFELDYTDFEDALQTQCAKKINANYIVTRNEKDFKDKTIQIVSPEKFLSNVENNL